MTSWLSNIHFFSVPFIPLTPYTSKKNGIWSPFLVRLRVNEENENMQIKTVIREIKFKRQLGFRKKTKHVEWLAFTKPSKRVEGALIYIDR